MPKDPGQPDPTLDARGVRPAIVVSRFNPEITESLLAGALDELERLGGDRAAARVVRVPGAFELPVAAGALARSGTVDAVVALGCLIHGETAHDRVIADAVAGALAALSAHTGVPIGFGVLTVGSIEQARARAGGERGNKGADALAAAVETYRALSRLTHSREAAP